jgi:hypothetical protein
VTGSGGTEWPNRMMGARGGAVNRDGLRGPRTHFRQTTPMKSALVLLVALLAGAASAQSGSRPPARAETSQGANAAALDMVTKLRLGNNMKSLGLHAAGRTQTFAAIAKSVGPDKARAIVYAELEKAAPKYQAQWDRNLAAAYAPLFSAQELQSIADQQKQSPHMAKFTAKQNEVGFAMQMKSSELLKSYVAEAMANAQRKVAAGK